MYILHVKIINNNGFAKIMLQFHNNVNMYKILTDLSDHQMHCDKKNDKDSI